MCGCGEGRSEEKGRDDFHIVPLEVIIEKQ
jgi:hypothetical protein